jgi:hypothetical protein
MLNKDLGTATITHPFHPLQGKTFAILKTRNYPTGRFVSLQDDNDVFCVPESWITPRNSSCESPFNAEVLQLLLNVVKIHKNSIDKS